jgi:sec-independent protein translocase protein TatA
MLGDLFDSPWKILIVAVVLIVLFGSKKLPDAARSLGKSMRILKAEVSDLHHDDPATEAAKAAAEAPPAPVLQQQLQIEQLQQQLSDLQKSAANRAAESAANGAAAPADAPLTETQRTQQPS